MRTVIKCLSAGRVSITYTLFLLGSDVVAIVSGGAAHVGSVVLAYPSPSLADRQATSATSSVLNVAGHKDEFLLRDLAEHTAAQTNRNVTCLGGVHYDGLTEEELAQVRGLEIQAREQCESWLAELLA